MQTFLARAQRIHTSRHTINCSLTGSVHLSLTRVMGLSDGDNRASSGTGPATHNHSRYTDTETLNRWMSEEGCTICTINMKGRRLYVGKHHMRPLTHRIYIDVCFKW